VRRIWTVVIVIAALISLSTALANASGGKPKLQLHKTKVGTILVDNHGYTVYAFAKDRRDKDVCIKIAACLTAWPPVKAGGVIAGHGVKASLVGTIKLKNGTVQLTYAGHPLYTYAGDTQPAETEFVNLLQFGGRWPALNAAGKEIK